MIEQLGALTPMWQGWLSAAIAVFFRVGAAMAVLPAFGERSVPARVRLILALAFTSIVLPLLKPATDGLLSLDTLLFLLMTETLVGLALGLSLRLFIIALQVAGSMAAQATSLAQIFAGANSVEPQPAIGHVLVVAGLAIAALNDLHLKIVEAFLLTYEIFPAGEIMTPADTAEWGTSRVAYTFSLAFSLAGPFIIGALIYNVAIGVINKAMPQLMVALVGAPAITAAGLILLLLSSPYLLDIWQRSLTRAMQDPFGVL